MNKYLSIIIGLLATGQMIGQEFSLPIQNQYLADNPYLISSSYAGIGDCWQARVDGFEQWIGLEEAPSIQTVSIDGRISDRSGVGAIIFNDRNGFTSQRGFQLSFAHHMTLNDYNNQFLSLGISYKFTQFGIDTSEFNRGIPSTALNGDLSVNNSNFDIGALYRFGKFFLSLNAINLIQKETIEFSLNEPSIIQNYYGYMGYTFNWSTSDLEIEPSVLYQNFAGDTRSTADLVLKVRKVQKLNYFWAGAMVRGLIDQEFKPLSVSPMLGIKRGMLYFSYGYQINVNEIIPVSSGSHLISLGFDFGCRQSNCGCTY